jgi:prevent-host-death family protein
MRDTYSLYEAKARLSALVRRVREGSRVIITVHGEPAAELRPVESTGKGLAGRLDRLEATGALVRPPAGGRRKLTSVARRPGALKRFLRARD